MSEQTCPPADVLNDYALGYLDESASSDIDAHLKACADCQYQVETAWSDEKDPLVESLRQAILPQQARAAVEKEASKPTPPSAPASGFETSIETVRDYRLLRLLGRGGMGTVYLAEHTRIGKQVALKLIKSDRLQDEKTKARFEREMRAMGALEHANLVKAIDAGEHEGRMYLAMEYIDGASAGDIVRIMRQLAKQDACEIVRQAAVGLQHAYQELDAFVHRDIKPSNLLLSRKGLVKVADLGLVRAGNLFDDELALTATHGFVGTLDYTAPEQIDRGQDVDIRADVYALGATLYKLLAGQVPFSGERFESFSDKIHGISKISPTPIEDLRPELPTELTQFIHHMLAKEPQERVTSPGEVAIALQPFCESSNLTALIEQSEERKEQASNEETSTFDFISSAHTDTRPSIGVADSEVPLQSVEDDFMDSEEAGAVAVDSIKDSVKRKTSGSLLPPDMQKWLIYSASFLALLAGVLLIIPREKGDLTIDLNGVDEAKLQIRRFNGAVIDEGFEVRKGADNTLTLRAGEYEVMLVDADKHSLALSTDRVTISKQKLAEIEVSALGFADDTDEAALDFADAQTAAANDPPVRERDEIAVPIPAPSNDGTPIQIQEAPNIVRRSLEGSVPRHLSPWESEPNSNSRYVMITKGHAGLVNSIAIHPDESQFATAGDDQVLRIWSSEGQLLRAVPMSEMVLSMSWSPDGEDLVIAIGDELRFIDPTTGKPKDKLRGYVRSDHITSVEWSPDGKRLLVVDGREVEIVDLATTQFQTIELEGCNYARWRSNDQVLALVPNYSNNPSVMYGIDVNSRVKRALISYKPGYEPAGSFGGSAWWVSPNGKYVLSSTVYDSGLLLAEVDTGEVRSVDESIVNYARSAAWRNSDSIVVLSANSGPAWLTHIDVGSELKKTDETGFGRRHDGNYTSASRGNLSIFTHADGAITISRPATPPHTIDGAFAVKHREMFWRNRGQMLCLPEVELEFNGTKRHVVVNLADASFFTRNYGGSAFPNIDPLVISIDQHDHTKYTIWNASTAKVVRRGRIEGHDFEGISPDLERWIRFDHQNPRTLFNVANGNALELDQTSGSLSCNVAWAPKSDRVAIPYEHSGAFSIVHQNGMSRYVHNSVHGAIKGMRWPRPNRLEIMNQSGDLMTVAVRNNGLQVTALEHFDLECEVAAISDSRVALFVPRVARAYLFDRQAMAHIGTLQLLPRHQVAIFDRQGNYVENPQAERFLTYVVDTGTEYEVISPSDFQKSYGSNEIAEMTLLPVASSKVDGRSIAKGPQDAVANSSPSERNADLPDLDLPRRPTMNPYSLVDHPTAIKGIESWTVETQNQRGSLLSCEYSPDGNRLATANDGDGAIRIYDLINGAVRLNKIIVTPERGPHCWIDDSTIASAGRTELFVWDVPTGKLQRTTEGNKKWWFDSVRYLPSLNKILAVRHNVLDPSDPEKAWKVDLIDPTDFTSSSVIRDVHFNHAITFDLHPNGKHILGIESAPDGQSGTLRIWASTTDSNPIRTVKDVQTARWSPDGNYLAVYLKGKLVIVTHASFVDKNSRPEYRRSQYASEFPFNGIAWSRNGRSIAAWDAGNYFHVINTDSAASDSSARTSEGCHWVSWGNRYLVKAYDAGANIINAKTAVVLTTIPPSNPENAASNRWLNTKRELAKGAGFEAPMDQVATNAVAWDGSSGFVMNYDGMLANTANGESASLTGPNEPSVRSAFSDDHLWLVTATAHGDFTEDSASKVAVWRLGDTSQPVAQWPFDGPTNGLSMAQNGKFVVTGGSGTFLYDVNNLDAEPRRIADGSNYVSVSPDTKLLLTDHSLIDIDSGEELEGFSWPLSNCVWNSENRFTAFSGQVLRYYDSDTGETASQDFSDWDVDATYEMFNTDGTLAMWTRTDRAVRIVDYLTEGTPSLIRVQLRNNKWFDVTKSGHWSGASFVERQLRYVARLDDGSQITLTPSEFEKRFGWKNDPSAVWSPEPD